MPPKKSTTVGKKKTSKKVEYFLTVVVDQSHQALFTALQQTNSFRTPQQGLLAIGSSDLHGSGDLDSDSSQLSALGGGGAAAAAAAGNSNSQLSNASTTLSDGGKGSAAGMYLVKEDTGFDRSVVVVVGTTRPYLGSAVHQQNSASRPRAQQVCVVISVLPVEATRQLHGNGVLGDFLRDGLGVAAHQYTNFGAAAPKVDERRKQRQQKSQAESLFAESFDDDDDDGDDDDDDDDDDEDVSTVANQNVSLGNNEKLNLYPKMFLVIEAKPQQRAGDDYAALTDLTLFQRHAGVSHVSMTSHSTPTTDSCNYVLAVANYFSRKCSGKEGPVAQARDRDDTLKILEPNFMGKNGKVDTVNYLGAYKAFLREIDGVTEQTAINIVSRFPTLRTLLDAVKDQDNAALEVLAQTRMDNSNRAIGFALVQRIISRLMQQFDEEVVLHSSTRKFFEQKCAKERLAQQQQQQQQQQKKKKDR